MNKVTLTDVCERFRKYNADNKNLYGIKSNVPSISAIIVYKQSNFTKPYTEKERSYRVNNYDGKRFFNKMLGNSMWGDCLDGKDLEVRLDAYDWEIEYCYFEE